MLLLLSCVILQGGCWRGIAPARPPIQISPGFFTIDPPGMVTDPDAATQSDFARAWAQTYFAWEGCAANLSAVKTLINEQGGGTGR